ncbi:MAG: BrnT family toxin [Pyrinomonadaceae bacterium]
MDFEYDPQKSESNKIKHGIDFEAAQAIWKDPNAFDVPSDYYGEDRFLAIGEINGTLWTAIVTMRDEIVRIISVRRSRDNERQAYDYGRRTR